MIRIVARHFVAGVVLTHNCVSQTAPILHYMMGWSRRRVFMYCKLRRWKWDQIS
jgi:hypothetical protein